MKLAIVTETFPPEVNGVAMTFGVICRELTQRGHELRIYCPLRKDQRALLPTGTGKIRPMPGFRLPGYSEISLGYPARRSLEREWNEERPELVHVVTEGPLGASAITAARTLGIPVSSSFHTNFHNYTGHYGCAPLRSLALWWLRRVHNRTLRTFAPTRELCAELGGLGFRNLSVLSRGVDLRSFSPKRRSLALRSQWQAGGKSPVVLHVGTHGS
jgi:glycosyltransferase involved in cell wall biosynthesis